MATKVSPEIGCHWCDAPIPKGEGRYLVIRRNGEHVPVIFGPCHLARAQVAYKPSRKRSKLKAFNSHKKADELAEKLNANLNWRPVQRYDQEPLLQIDPYGGETPHWVRG